MTQGLAGAASQRRAEHCRVGVVAAVAAGLTLALMSTALLSGCTSGDAVVVGSKNFTEQRILGELLAQSIEAAGMKADRRLDLGGTFVCDSALRAGQIDVYVEYTGTALGAVLKETADPTASSDPAATVLARVRAGYAPAGLVWTEPLGFDNSFALVVRGDTEVRTISDSVQAARTWRAAFGYEFQQRADGYPALKKVYDLAFAEIHTMDLGLLYRALVDGQADVVVGSATDAAISRFDLKVLEDDRRAFPPYQAVPVARQAALDHHPALAAVLAELGGSLDVATMRSLNQEVDAEHRSPADVVRGFLASRANALR